MKYIALITVLLTLSTVQPSAADQPASAADLLPQAKTTPAQRAYAELVSARIRAALDGEAYKLEQPCDNGGCTVSRQP